MKRLGRFIRRHPWLTLAVYTLALASTWIIEAVWEPARIEWGQEMLRDLNAVEVEPVIDSDEGEVFRSPYLVADTGPLNQVPIVLLHGSPGGAVGMNLLAEELKEDGRRALWFDLPGFVSQSDLDEIRDRDEGADYGADTYAEVVIGILDAMHIDRAHIVGWSNGGAVALYLAHDYPDRVASITMLGSVGAQETEGSGSYFFEHAKYKIGQAVLNYGAKLVPHFGVLGPPHERRAFLWNFTDTDQRELTAIMPTITTPTLILHGRDDFLTPDWAAEKHYELISTSSLVMTEHDHFMPFLEPEETAEHIAEFVARYDTPGVPAERFYEDEAPRRTPFGEAGAQFLNAVRYGPWLGVVLASALAALILGRVGQAWIVVLMGATELDIGLAWVALSLAMIVWMVIRGDERDWKAWVSSLIRPGLMLGAGFFLTQLAFRPLGLALGEFGWTLSVLIMALAIELNIRPFTREGRLGILIQWKRIRHHEWWPTWAMHWVAIPTFVASAIKHRHPLVFTCCNPGIDQGGGFAGESKIDVLTGLLHAGDDIVLFGDIVRAVGSPAERAKRARSLIDREPRLGGYPVVLKPNQGENGRGLKICRDDADVNAYFERTHADVLIQKFHPGPYELGVFWVRSMHADSDRTGTIFSICRKEFPVLECDGLRTIGELIDAHPRYKLQRDVFRKRFADRLGEVPESGAHIALSPAGNHKQGAIFYDAPDLMTPELEAAIDRVSSAFTGPSGGGLDFGRFDVRYADESELKAGRGLAVIELNGVTSETINIYDPNLSVWFAWRILRRQWRLACELGAWRKAQGFKPMSVFGILFGTRKHLRGRRVYAPAS